jgi:hypothetical protein
MSDVSSDYKAGDPVLVNGENGVVIGFDRYGSGRIYDMHWVVMYDVDGNDGYGSFGRWELTHRVVLDDRLADFRTEELREELTKRAGLV